MAGLNISAAVAAVSMSIILQLSFISPMDATSNFTEMDKELIGVALNLEYFEAEFFLFGALGAGLDKYGPSLTGGGPAPIGAQKANLDHKAADVFAQLGFQEVGHLRAIKSKLEKQAFPRPLLNIGKETWATVFDSAMGTTLSPPFDVYANSVNYYLASYAIPYVGLTGYTAASPLLEGAGAKSLVSRLLGVESGQDAVIRTWLYERKHQKVKPYDFTIGEVTGKLSQLRNALDHGDLDDEGLIVPKALSSEGLTRGNILSCDVDSLSYTRTPTQIFGIVYSTGDASMAGGFYPNGGNGTIAKGLLGQTYP